MSAYGYDPSRFINDYSWIGDIGRAVSKTASKIPELVEYNKQLHTNNQFKQMNYEAMHQMLGNLEGDQLAKVALGFGVTIPEGGLPEGESHYDYLRKRLQEKVPTFHDTMDNKEYAHQVANQFGTPLAKLIFDGTMNYSDFFDWKQGLPGDMQEPIAQSSMGQQMSQEREHQRGIAQEEAQYDRDRGRETEMAADLEGIYQDVVGLYDPKLSVPENFRKMSSEIGGTAKHRGIEYGPEQSTIIYNRIKDLANMEQKSMDSDRAHHARMTAARNRGSSTGLVTTNDINRIIRDFNVIRSFGNAANNAMQQANRARLDGNEDEANRLMAIASHNEQKIAEFEDIFRRNMGDHPRTHAEANRIAQETHEEMQRNESIAAKKLVEDFNEGKFDTGAGWIGRAFGATGATKQTQYNEFVKAWKERFLLAPPPKLGDDGNLIFDDSSILPPMEMSPGGNTQPTREWESNRVSVSGTPDDVKQWSDDDAIAEVRRRMEENR